jgi:peptidoglycan/LPS O-acetylase OafA/YrhL
MNNKREYWIDWLRISCSWLIVIYHANRLFDEKGTKIFENHVPGNVLLVYG